MLDDVIPSCGGGGPGGGPDQDDVVGSSPEDCRSIDPQVDGCSETHLGREDDGQLDVREGEVGEVPEGNADEAAFTQSFVTSDVEMDEGHEVLVVDEEGDSFSSSSEDSESGNEPPLSTSEKHSQIRMHDDKLYRANVDKLCLEYGYKKKKDDENF